MGLRCRHAASTVVHAQPGGNQPGPKRSVRYGLGNSSHWVASTHQSAFIAPLPVLQKSVLIAVDPPAACSCCHQQVSGAERSCRHHSGFLGRQWDVCQPQAPAAVWERPVRLAPRVVSHPLHCIRAASHLSYGCGNTHHAVCLMLPARPPQLAGMTSLSVELVMPIHILPCCCACLGGKHGAYMPGGQASRLIAPCQVLLWWTWLAMSAWAARSRMAGASQAEHSLSLKVRAIYAPARAPLAIVNHTLAVSPQAMKRLYNQVGRKHLCQCLFSISSSARSFDF